MTKVKLLLDTDIGSDIDDALTLCYLLSNPGCELMGITTVTGESEKRAELAHQICMESGHYLPIFPGASEPLQGTQRQPIAQLATDLRTNRFGSSSSPDGAIDFLHKTIIGNPGEITLLSIGPLTNIALLFTRYPETAGLLKQLVLMCGVFHYELPGLQDMESEWNASVDPAASSIVYKSMVPVHRSVGLDVTCQLVIRKEIAKKCFDVESLSAILPLIDRFTYHNCITFHDPLAAVSVFEQNVCRFVKGMVTVNGVSDDMPGKTFWKAQKPHLHEVASEVDAPLFFHHFFETLGCSFDLETTAL
ncbi:MAG: nucleoside hydrolase [Fibrobacter sp.]|nr:nucleoside hydrolase [Fibrobacter sp.]